MCYFQSNTSKNEITKINCKLTKIYQKLEIKKKLNKFIFSFSLLPKLKLPLCLMKQLLVLKVQIQESQRQ